jgi:hypothetical protein
MAVRRTVANVCHVVYLIIKSSLPLPTAMVNQVVTRWLTTSLKIAIVGRNMWAECHTLTRYCLFIVMQLLE